MAPGERMRVSSGGCVAVTSERLDQMSAWRDGRLVATDRPASEIVDVLRAYYHGLIVVADSALAGKRVTGVYDLRDPASALHALAQAHGQSVHQISPWLLVLTGG